MPLTARHARPASLAGLTALAAADEARLLDCARALQRAAEAGSGRPLLFGANLALLGDDAGGEAAARFRLAATALGARVAHVRPALSLASSDADMVETGRILGRLYDGIECLDLDASLVTRLGIAADVPVYDGISSRRHPSARLAEQLAAGGAPDDRHRFLIQAILVVTLGSR